VVGVRQVVRGELNADRGEVLLDHLHGGHPVGVVADVVDREGQLLPGRVRHDPAGHVVAGLGQQRLRLGLVVPGAPGRQRRLVQRGGEGGGDDAGLVRGRLVTRLAGGGDLAPVDRVRDGLPHFHVLELRIGQVRDQRDVDRGGEPVVVVRALGRVERLDARDVLAAPLRAAVGQVVVGRVVAGVGRVLDRLDLRHPRLPVRRVRLVGDVLRGALAHRVRAGADRGLDRVGDRVGHLREDVLGHDRRLVRDVVEVRHGHGLEVHRDRVAARGDAGQHRPRAGQVQGGVLLRQVEGVGHVVGRHRRAVAPLDPGADGERERLVAGAPFVRGGEHRRGLALLQRVHVDERLVHEAVRQHGEGGVERIETAAPELAGLVGDGQRAVGRGLGGVAVARAGTRGGA